MAKIQIDLQGMMGEILVHRPHDVENCVLSMTILASPEDNNDLLNAMSSLLLLREKARFSIYAEELEEDVGDEG
jgi:hypothetical protein